MQIINKTKLTATIATILLIASAFMLMAIPLNAQYEEPAHGEFPADGVVDTHIYLSFRPNPVGFGQDILINLYSVPAPGPNRMHPNFTLVINKPSGEVIIPNISSYPDDGTAWLEYPADEIGEWSFQFIFNGTFFPAGIYNDGEMVDTPIFRVTTEYAESAYYLPAATPVQTLTVQEEQVLSWPADELPTDYWTRPVAYEHREWWPILGDYPWRGPATDPMFEELYPNTNPLGSGVASRYFFTPWVEAPESPHVVWKRVCQIAGLLGGDEGIKPADANLFAGGGMGAGAYSNGMPQIIYQGRAYEIVWKPMTQMVGDEIQTVTTTVWQCYDIRTGEVYWEQDAATLVQGFGPFPSVYDIPTEIEYEGIANPGGGGDPQQSAAVTLIHIYGGRLKKWRPMNGELAVDVSIAPVSSGTYYRNGYALSVQDLGADAAPDRYRLINWTTFGSSGNFASRVVNNVSWPYSSVPATTDYTAGVAASSSNIQVGGAYTGLSISAADLTTGQELWSHMINGTTQFSGSTNVADHGLIAVLTEQGSIWAWNLRSGNLAWTSEPMEYPWDEPGFGAYSLASAYGLLIRNAYSGIYAFNWDDGTIAWKYEAPAEFPYETPYIDEDGNTMYSWNIGGTIADGKYYVYNTEHSATVPITRGWKLHAIDIFEGKEIWSVMLPGGASKHDPDIGPVADGYLTLAGSDGIQYVFGKGQSKTTVAGPTTSVPKGTTMTITGSVLDMSPAQPGTPAVNVSSMDTQMEYLHKQMPINGIHGNETITGVEVSLVALGGPNGFEDIGKVITDGYYGTFGIPWTPAEEGTYEIVASFEGDESYGSSAASTYVTVGPEGVDVGPIEGSVSNVEDAISNLTTYVIVILVIVIIALIVALYAAFKSK